jgi:WD40 repeat protein
MADKLRARFYMERMGIAAALDAVKKPAEVGDRPFAPDVAEALVNNLRQIKITGQEREQLGQYVEPVQLQVVCYELWEKLKSRPVAPISAEDRAEIGDVDRALIAFYNRAITSVVQHGGVYEGKLRQWFSEQLVTPAGTRNLLYQGKTETAGLPNNVVQLLEDQFLLRIDARAGGYWIELVHDRLVEPILRANRVWLDPTELGVDEQQVASPEPAEQVLAHPIRNPYIGPRTFSEAERHLFFGRDREARALLAQVISQRLTLVYGPSGVGKSSLVNTKLMPGLRQRGFRVMPVGRVSGMLSVEIAAVENHFALHLMLSLDQGISPPELLSQLQLNEFFVHFVDTDGGWHYDQDYIQPSVRTEPGSATATDYKTVPYVVIIDQFEEFLTTNVGRRPEQAGFITQLNAAMLAHPHLLVVLVLRSDFVGDLDPYTHLFDDRLRSRFYVERMGAPAALEAVTRPAQVAGHPFEAGVAEKLVDDLQQVVGDHGSATRVPGGFVEPIQLQIVCYQLWERLRERLIENRLAQEIASTDQPISEEQLAQLGGFVEQSLSSYYEDGLQHVLQTPGIAISERALRIWFSNVLITPAETRALVYQGQDETAGLPNQAVMLLADLTLIRFTLRAGVRWCELVHDRLVAPILEANRAWNVRNESPLSSACRHWLEAGRNPKLLLIGENLHSAVTYADANRQDISVDELEFLQASKQQAAEQMERQWRTRLAAFSFIVVLIALSAWALWNWRIAHRAEAEATQARDAAQMLRLAAEAVIERTASPPRGLLLALAATQITIPGAESPAPEAVRALRTQFDQWSYWQQSLLDNGADVRAVTFGRQDGQLFTAAVDGRLLAWQINASGAQARTLLTLDQAIDALKLHPQQDWLAVGTEQGQIHLVNLNEPVNELAFWQAHTTGARVLALAFSADGRWLISGGADGLIKFWPMDPPNPNAASELSIPNGEECQPDCWVRTLALSADGRWLAAGAQNQRFFLWRLEPDLSATLVLNVRMLGNVRAVTFSHDNGWLAVGDESGLMTIYALADSQLTSNVALQPRHRVDLAHATPIFSLDFSPHQPLLAVGYGSGTVDLLPVGDVLGALRTVGKLDAAIQALTFSPSGERLASAVADNETTATADSHITLWHTEPVNAEPQLLSGHSAGVRALLYHPAPLTTVQPTATGTLVSAGEDGTVRFWAPEQQLSALQVITETGNRILAAAVSSDGNWLATGGRDGQVRLYVLPVTAAPTLLGAYAGTVLALAFSPDGAWLASGGSDPRVLLWSLTNRQAAPLTLDNQQGGVLALAFGADSRQLATGDEARRVKVWDLTASPPTMRLLYTHHDWVWAVAFSPDGRYLASTGADSMLRLTPLQTGVDAQGPLFAHGQRARTLTFTAAGALLATGGDDALIKLWNSHHLNAQPQELSQHTGIVRALAFLSDDRWLASAGDDQVIRLWTVALADLQQMAC